MDPENMAANADAVDVAAPEGVAAPVNTEPATPETVPTASATPDAQEQKITKIVAERIRKEQERIATEASQREKQRADALMAKVFREQGYTTLEQVEEALRQHEAAEAAAQANVPVEFYNRLTQAERDALDAKTRLSEYERRESVAKEAESLSTDQNFGEFYKNNADEIRQIADLAKCDLRSALLVVLGNKGIPRVDTEAIKSQAIQEYLDKKRTFKPVEGGGATPVVVPSSPKSWEEARANSVAKLRASRET